MTQTEQENEFVLGAEDVLQYIKNRPPLLMVDYAPSVVPGVSAVGIKELPSDSWFFACHFPGNPLVPGVLQLEAMYQTAALALHTLPGNQEKTSYIGKTDRVSYLAHIRPGKTMRMETKILRWRHGIGQVHGDVVVDGKIVCCADFVLVIEEDMASMKREK